MISLPGQAVPGWAVGHMPPMAKEECSPSARGLGAAKRLCLSGRRSRCSAGVNGRAAGGNEGRSMCLLQRISSVCFAQARQWQDKFEASNRAMGGKEQKIVMGVDRLSSERWRGKQRVIERWSCISPLWEGAVESWLLFELEGTSPCPSLAKRSHRPLQG